MSAPARAAAGVAAMGAVALGVAGLVALPAWAAGLASGLYLLLLGLIALVALACLAWLVDPAITLTAAIVLTPLAGNWPELGVPGPLSPDRLLFIAATAAVLLRAPPVRDRPPLRLSAVHWLLAVALVYAVSSAFVVGTLFQRDPLLKIVDAYGVLPFAAFLVAPIAFRSPDQRRMLLAALVALGAYLGLTVLFETVHLDALVWPRYILDASYGLHAARGRGPFVDAVANGAGLYFCAVACAIAAATWRSRGSRLLAMVIGVLCLIGTFFSLERSVWIGATLGTAGGMLVAPRLRRYLVPLAVAVAVGIIAAVTIIPGFSTTVRERVNSKSLWDRQNLARAAINMVEARPLFGFGWSRFTSDSTDYFQQAPDYPLTATGIAVHNIPLTYASDLGLVGLTIWGLAVLLGVGGAIATRGPPDLLPWRVGLLAVATAYMVIMNSVPPTAWVNRSLWFFAGVVCCGRYAQTESRSAT